MISAHTPPGTKVVALFTLRMQGFMTEVGAVYTVDEMVVAHDGDICVLLREFDHTRPVPVSAKGGLTYVAFARSAFRYASLPSCLTELLQTRPVDLPETVGG